MISDSGHKVAFRAAEFMVSKKLGLVSWENAYNSIVFYSQLISLTISWITDKIPAAILRMFIPASASFLRDVKEIVLRGLRGRLIDGLKI